MTLLVELDARRREAGAEYINRIASAARALDAVGLPKGAKAFGEPAPDFGLVSSQGATVVLSELLLSGPVAISFYRGEWCPFCRAELDALLAAQAGLARLGATLLLISAEAPSDRLATQVARLGPRVYLLRDPMLGVALNYGLVYRVPETLRDYYLAETPGLARDLAAQSWLLPLPADFVIGTDGRIALAYGEVDFTQRLDPALLVEKMETMTTAP